MRHAIVPPKCFPSEGELSSECETEEVGRDP